MNTLGRHIPNMTVQAHNPCFLHPDTIDQKELAEGDVVELSTDYGSIQAVITADPSMRGDSISMFHVYGDLPNASRNVREHGSNPGLLRSLTEDINAMPRMTGVPVAIKRIHTAPATPHNQRGQS